MNRRLISVSSSLLLGLLLNACIEDNLPDNTGPQVRVNKRPPCGDTTYTFVFDASTSRDREDAISLMKFSWDLNGDSIWDTAWNPDPYLIVKIPVPGVHHYGVRVVDRFGLMDSTWFSVETWGKNTDTSHMTDPRDQKVYRTVKIGNHWWMAENLNYGRMICDRDMASDNAIPEKYCYLNDSLQKTEYGGNLTYYEWEEFMDYDTHSQTGLCPPGWRIPSQQDWENLFDSLIYRGHKTYLSENRFSSLNLTYSGYHILSKSWDKESENPDFKVSAYFSGSFSKEPYGGRNQPCPWVATNRGIILLRFMSDSVKYYKAALPVRCIKPVDR